jgi:hypothetical protein
MSAMTISHLAFSALLCCTALLTVSCSSTQADSVHVKKYVLDHRKRVDAADPSIRFEQRYRLYGCVTAADMEARDGAYYTTRWTLGDGQPATLVMEYRQAKTGAAVKRKEAEVSGASGIHEFTIIGEEAKKDAVTNWKISLMRGKTELASSKSYLWE